MGANRCSICAVNYPQTYHYAVCPVCQERTSPITNETPMSPASARAIAENANFERYYEQTHEAKRTGPDPEELGRQDAAEILALERALDQSDQLPETGDLPSKASPSEKATDT